MRTLLVLCAGNKKINHIPVFMNRHPDGKLLAEKAIEGIFYDTYERIIYVITQDIDEKYNAKSILEKTIGDRIEVVCLTEETQGPADTVFHAVKMANIKGEFAVRDCLNSIEIKNNIYGNFVSGLDLTKHDQDVYRVKTKSFIVVNEQKQILDIVEKRFRSDVISVGLYGFKSVDDFLEAYHRLKDPAYPIQKLYLSNIISYLIGYKQRVFHCIAVTNHEDWGSLETWNLLQREYATCVIDADSMIGEVLSNGNLKSLADIICKSNRRHIHYVIMTAGIISSDEIKDTLVRHGIRCVGVISGISQSNKKMIVSTPDQLQLVAMEV